MAASCNSSIGITTYIDQFTDKNADKNTEFKDIILYNNYKNIMKAVKLHAIFNKNASICMNTPNINLVYGHITTISIHTSGRKKINFYSLIILVVVMVVVLLVVGIDIY